jgi:hypothetical protein
VECTSSDKAGNAATPKTFTVTIKQRVTGTPEAEIRKLLEEVQSAAIPTQIRATLADLLNGALHSVGHGRGAVHQLGQVVRALERDQRSGHPQIPAELASAWITTAKAIEASLNSPGGPRGGGHHHARTKKKTAVDTQKENPAGKALAPDTLTANDDVDSTS